MRAWAVLLASVMMWLTGCGGSSGGEPKAAAGGSPSPSISGQESYVAAINAICADQLSQVLAATHGGHPEHFPIATFKAEDPKMAALTGSFDAKVAAVPVPADAQSAAATLKTYMRAEDAAARRLSLAAATGDQAKFDAAYDANNSAFGAVSEPMTSAGFSRDCNAR